MDERTLAETVIRQRVGRGESVGPNAVMVLLIKLDQLRAKVAKLEKREG